MTAPRRATPEVAETAGAGAPPAGALLAGALVASVAVLTTVPVGPSPGPSGAGPMPVPAVADPVPWRHRRPSGSRRWTWRARWSRWPSTARACSCHRRRPTWPGGTPVPAPGETGPAVVAGHVDSHLGPGVFADRARLRPGDRVEIDRADGGVTASTVRHVQQVAKSAFPTSQVYGPTTGPQLRLITCGGEFDGDHQERRPL